MDLWDKTFNFKISKINYAATSNQQPGEKWFNFLKPFLFLFIISLAIVSCEKDPIINDPSNSHNDDGNGMFKTMQVNDLPQLKEELNHLTERRMAKSGSSSNEASFELFENYDVNVVTIDSTITYTLPIIQQRENDRQFSNLVLTYTNDVLTDSFILGYEGTEAYFSEYLDEYKTPFSGEISMIKLKNAPDLFAKSSSCGTIIINFCRNDGEGGEGSTHLKGKECDNKNLMWSVELPICTGKNPTFDDGLPKPGGGENQDGSGSPLNSGNNNPANDPDVGLGTGIPVSGNNTGPMPNPPCESDPLSYSDGNGGCFDAGDDLIDDQDLLNSEYYLQNDKEPIKQYVGTVNDFRDAIDNSRRQVGRYKGQEASDYLKSLSDTEFNFTQMRPLPTQAGFYNTIKGRYIYTKKGGWIDVAHFMFYAGKAYNYKLEGEANPIGEAVQDGYAQENSDLIVSSHSAFSYEDLPSDKFGAEFAVNHFDINSNLTFGEQLNNYFSNVLEAVAPEIAPNFESIPESDSRNSPSRTNDSTTPVYTDDNP